MRTSLPQQQSAKAAHPAISERDVTPITAERLEHVAALAYYNAQDCGFVPGCDSGDSSAALVALEMADEKARVCH